MAMMGGMDAAAIDQASQVAIRRAARITDAARRMTELEANDEPEAASRLLVHLLTTDMPTFGPVLDRASVETLTAADMAGRTLLHYTAMLGCTSAVTKLLSCSAVDANVQDDQGSTPLHLAAGNGERNACAALLAHSSVNTGVKDAMGRTPLEVASADAAQFFFTEAVNKSNGLGVAETAAVR